MIGFVRDTWRRFRTPNDKGRVLFWPWAAMAVAVISVFYGIIASIWAMLTWIWRRVFARWFGGAPGDRPGDALFYSKPTANPSGNGGALNLMGGDGPAMAQSQQQSAQKREQEQIAHERAMERAWAEEMEMRGMPQDYFDDDPFGEGPMFDPRLHAGGHGGERRERGQNGGYPTGQYNREMGFPPNHPHYHQQHHHHQNHHNQHHQHHPHRGRRHGRNRRRRRQFHRGGSPRMRILFG